MAGRDTPSNLGCEDEGLVYLEEKGLRPRKRSPQRKRDAGEREEELRDKMEVHIFLRQSWLQIQEHRWVVPGQSSLENNGKITGLCVAIHAAPVNTDDQSSCGYKDSQERQPNLFESKASPKDLTMSRLLDDPSLTRGKKGGLWEIRLH